MQADNSRFLSTVAALFLPLSYLASIWGFTTITWPAIWYLWVAIPVLIVSVAGTFVFPVAVRRVQKALYPIEDVRVHLKPSGFTMLGNELPDSVDVAGGIRPGKVKGKAQRLTGLDGARARSRDGVRSEKE